MMAARFQEAWIQNGWQSRLDRLLDLIVNYDILLLEAPIGFGKQRTVERWHHLLASSGRAIYRIDCKPSGTEPKNTDNFTNVPPYCTRWQQDGDAARGMLTSFVRDDHEGRVLIIENLHDLPASDMDFVRAHLCDLPPMANAVLTCHSIPADWTVSLIAGGQVRIIGEDQLALDFDEFAERIQTLCAERFPPYVLRRIFGVTGGWSAAIEHAAVHILGSPNRMEAAENFPDLWPEQEHWMREKIWQALDQPEQDFLRQLAVLGDAPLEMALACDTTGSKQAPAMIDRLSKRTPFFHHDGHGRPSLRKLAARFLQKMDCEDNRQAIWLRNILRSEPAIDGLTVSPVPDTSGGMKKGELLGDKLLDLVASGKRGLARQWLDMLSGSDFRNASALFAIGVLGNDDLLRHRLQEHEDIASPSPESPDRILLRALLAAIDDDVDQLDSCLGLLGENSGLSGSLAAAEQTLRLRCMRQLGSAQPFASMALAKDDTRRDDGNFGFYCATALVDGAILLDMGQADAAVRLLVRVRNMALEKLGWEALPTIELTATLAAAHLQAQQTEEARALMKSWVVPDLKCIDPWALQLGYLTLARLAAHDGRPSDALSLLETLARFVEDRHLLVAQARIGTEIVHMAIEAGQPAVVRHMATKLTMILGEAKACGSKRRDLVQLYASCGLAQIAIWTRDWTEALARLDDAQPLAQRFGRILELTRIYELKEYYRSVKGENIVTEDPTPLVGATDRKTVLSEINRLREQPPGNDSTSAAALTLTQKEREVLELMARGFTKPLIAQALAISRETVKWHQKNIYGKFDIHDRQNVLSKARQLGMV